MKAKVLVIEDTQDVRENIKEILETEDYLSYSAANGVEGVEIAKQVQPDLILCDIMMPEMDGYEVLTRIRGNVLTASVPFIFLTAKGTVDNIREGMVMGADDYIPKPFKIDQLLKAVETRLDRNQLIKEQAEEAYHELSNRFGLPIATEIKRPLNTVVGYSELITHGEASMTKEEIVGFVTQIQKAGRKLDKVVQKVLTYYRLEILGHHPEDVKKLQEIPTSDPKTVIEIAARESAANYKREADLSLALCDATLSMPSDILGNITKELVENSFLYSPKSTLVKITSTIQDSMFVMNIEDEGIGMNDEQIGKIGAYVQVLENTERSEENVGLGLGLYNTKTAVGLFGGTFTIESHPNQGTLVTVNLPIR